MDLAKPITAIITVFGLGFIVSMCNNVSNHSTKSSNKLEDQAISQETAIAAAEVIEEVQDTSETISSNNQNEEVPFKVSSQQEYNYETQHIISLVEQKMSNIYEQDTDTKYRIICLELPMMVYSLNAFSEANPEYSDPKVSFDAVIASVEAVQKDVVGSCN